MKRAVGLAVGLALGLTAGIAAAQHEHHHGTGQTPGHAAGHAHHAPSLEAGVAVDGAVIAAGGYQGVAPTLAWSRGRLGLRIVVPAYHIERNGFEDTGLGDVILSAHAALVAGHDWGLGTVVAVGLPTGDAGDRLGMGHVMVMPSLFLAVRRGRAAYTVHLGAGKSLGDDDDHMAHGGSAVSPMNPFELGGSLRAGLDVAPSLAVHTVAGIAVPVGDGVTRSTCGVGGRLRAHAGDVGFEVHLPLAGDPYRVRIVADVAYRF